MFCSVYGCEKPMLARGYCCAHYNKWRKYGDPLRQKIAKRGDALTWLRSLVTHDGNTCLLWPFKSRYSNGYGSVWFNGRLSGAHRVMCILSHGEPPSPILHAAHSCGNKMCVNPKHLRWATGPENELDKKAHGCGISGERNPRAKLTRSAVAEIRQLKGDFSQGQIAARFGVSRRLIGLIHQNIIWKDAAE